MALTAATGRVLVCPVPQSRARASNQHGCHGAPRSVTLGRVPPSRSQGPRLARRRRPSPRAEGSRMPTVTVGKENSADIEIYYEDHGAGRRSC